MHSCFTFSGQNASSLRVSLSTCLFVVVVCGFCLFVCLFVVVALGLLFYCFICLFVCFSIILSSYLRVLLHFKTDISRINTIIIYVLKTRFPKMPFFIVALSPCTNGKQYMLCSRALQ